MTVKEVIVECYCGVILFTAVDLFQNDCNYGYSDYYHTHQTYKFHES